MRFAPGVAGRRTAARRPALASAPNPDPPTPSPPPSPIAEVLPVELAASLQFDGKNRYGYDLLVGDGTHKVRRSPAANADIPSAFSTSIGSGCARPTPSPPLLPPPLPTPQATVFLHPDLSVLVEQQVLRQGVVIQVRACSAPPCVWVVGLGLGLGAG